MVGKNAYLLDTIIKRIDNLRSYSNHKFHAILTPLFLVLRILKT
jgi:hypothetical protein